MRTQGQRRLAVADGKDSNEGGVVSVYLCQSYNTQRLQTGLLVEGGGVKTQPLIKFDLKQNVHPFLRI